MPSRCLVGPPKVVNDPPSGVCIVTAVEIKSYIGGAEKQSDIDRVLSLNSLQACAVVRLAAYRQAWPELLPSRAATPRGTTNAPQTALEGSACMSPATPLDPLTHHCPRGQTDWTDCPRGQLVEVVQLVPSRDLGASTTISSVARAYIQCILEKLFFSSLDPRFRS